MSAEGPPPFEDPSAKDGAEDLHHQLQALAFQRNELRLANRRLNAQVAAAKILFTYERVEDALPLLIEALCAVFDWDLGLYWFKSPRGLHCGFAFPEEALGAEGMGVLPTPLPVDALVGRAIAAGEVMWSFEPSEVPEVAGISAPFSCAFAIPVIGERSHGVLLFLGRSFLEAEAEFLDGLLAVGTSFGRFIDRRLLMAELARTRDAALAASRSKSQFLANLSHELRTPLNAVLGFSDLLLQDPMPPTQRHLMGEVREGGRKLLRMVNDLLEFAQLQSRRAHPEPHPFALAAFMDSMEDLGRSRAADKNLSFRAEADPHLPRWVSGDDGRIRQALLPLLDNALRFTEQGSVVLRAKHIAQEGQSVTVAFEVVDSGPGIPAAQLPRVMQPFHQADTSDTRHFGGLGLGLSVAQEVASMLRGRIELTSEEGRGSTATLIVELEVAEPPTPPKETPSKLSGRVLVVEDNPINQLVATSLLAALGLTSEVAEHGAVALEKLARGSFDLVLMDCQMPVMDGWETTKRFRASETSGHMPIVALTASSTEDDMGRCNDSGMDDFLAKPIDLQVLAQMLHKYLGAGH
jgi:signal transduction histidine kinase